MPLVSLASSPVRRGPLGAVAPVVPTLDFFADWRTATGTSASAVGDGGKFNQIGGSGSTVIANPGNLGFPADLDNVLQVIALTANAGYTEPRKTSGITAPAVGETRYYRVYFRLDSATDDIPPYTGPDTGDDETHPIQDGSSASQINWGNWIYHNTGGAGKWTLQWRPSASANAFPNDRWQLGTALDKDTTYRLEWSIARTGATTFKAAYRVFNEAVSVTVPAYTGANFNNQNSSATLDGYMASNDFTFFNIANIVSINTGLNGLDGSANLSGWPAFAPLTYSYQGALATGIDCGWIGAYNPANG